MPRCVLLEHITPLGYDRGDHWDLLLEHGDQLWAWALVSLPQNNLQQWAERLPDHRPFYLDYSGPVANDRGTVARIAQGNFELVHELVHNAMPQQMQVVFQWQTSSCELPTQAAFLALAPGDWWRIHWHCALQS